MLLEIRIGGFEHMKKLKILLLMVLILMMGVLVVNGAETGESDAGYSARAFRPQQRLPYDKRKIVMVKVGDFLFYLIKMGKYKMFNFSFFC